MTVSNTDFKATIQGTAFSQFGKKVLTTQISFSTLEAMFKVDHEVQRRLDPSRRAEIRDFILRSLTENKPFYFSPFIFSSRKGISEGVDGFELEPGNKLYILDGQHRGSALASAIAYLKSEKEADEEFNRIEDAIRKQSYIDALSSYPVAMQIYLDLDQKEERQMFTDLNTERREAHKGLIMQYDHRDKYIEITRNVAESLRNDLEIEFEASRLTTQNSAVTSLLTMRRCLIAMYEGKLTAKTGDPYFRGCNPEEVPEISKCFFYVWKNLFPKGMANRKKYVTGLTGIQIALAYTVYLLTRSYSIKHKEAIKLLKLLNKQCTWKHDDLVFAHMYNPETQQLRNHSTTTAIRKTAVEFLKIIEKEKR